MYDIDEPARWFTLAALLCLALLRLLRVRRRSRGGRSLHERNKRASHARLATLNNDELSASPDRAFGYLRNVDFFVFEEMILTAFEQRGVKVIRNRRYTGDGGIDGRVIIGGETLLIQAKRYDSHINAGDVAAFAEICRNKRKRGLFIHTGRTGKKAHNNAVEANGIEIVSGRRLLDLLQGREVFIHGAKLAAVADMKRANQKR